MTATALSATHKPAGVIETHHADAATEWGYSFTSHNPEPDDYIRCASEADAWKLDRHIRRIESALASAEPVAWSRTDDITDDGGCPIGTDEPRVVWGSEHPDPSETWFPLYGGPMPVTHDAQPAAKVEAPSLDEVLATIRAYGEGCIKLGTESAPTPASDYPECSGDPASCPENEGHGCCKPNPVKTPASVPDYSYIIERIAASWDECMHVDSLDSVIDIGADIRDQWKRFVSDATNPAPASLEGFGPMPSPDLSGLTIRPTTPEPTP